MTQQFGFLEFIRRRTNSVLRFMHIVLQSVRYNLKIEKFYAAQ